MTYIVNERSTWDADDWYLYAAADPPDVYTAGHGITRWDISVPGRPRFVEWVSDEVPDELGGVFLKDHYLIALVNGDLVAYDVGTPGESHVVGTFDVGSARSVDFDGDLAYIVDSDETPALHVADYANPEAPVLLRSASLESPPMDVDVNGAIAYVATWDALEVFWTSDLHPLGHVALPPGVRAVTSFYDRVYLAAGVEGVIVAAYSEGDAFIVKTIDTAGFALDVASVSDHVLVADGTGGLRVFDAFRLEEVGSLATRYNLQSIAVAGNYAVCAGGSGFLVFGRADGRLPPAPARISIPTSLGMAFSGSRVTLAAATDGLVTLDLAEAVAPREIGRLDLPGTCRDVCFVENHAYVAAGVAGLQVVDMATPESPRSVGALPLAGDARHVCVDGSFAVVSSGADGFSIVDVSRPETPRVRSHVPAGEAFSSAISDGHAYLCAGEAGLQIIDLSHSSAPEIIGGITDHARDIHVAGGFAYLATGAEILVLDVLDPTRPVVRSRVRTAETTSVLAVQGSTCYVGSGDWGMHVIDVGDPSNPRFLGSSGAGHDAYEVGVANGSVYYLQQNTLLASPLECPATAADPASFRAVLTAEGVRVSWSATVEAETREFNLYRQDAGGGPERRVNLSPISAGETRYSFHDALVSGPRRCRYRLEETECPRLDPIVTTVASRLVSIPANPVHVSAASPTPSRGLVRFDVELREAARAEVTIHDAGGRRIRRLANEDAPAGRRVFVWDGLTDLRAEATAGVYFASFRIGDRTETRRIVLVR